MTAQLSVAVALNSFPVTVYVQAPELVALFALTATGQLITGFSVSLTVIVKLQLTVLFCASFAVHCTVVTPFCNTTPARFVPVPALAPPSEYVNEVTAQLSDAVALNSVPATVYVQAPVLVDLVALTATGQLITGLVISTTVIIRLCVLVRVQSSTKVQVSVYVPPHSVCEPVITPVVAPLIRHPPLKPLE